MAARQRKRPAKEERSAADSTELVGAETKEEQVDPILAQRAKVLKSYKKQILGRE